MAILSTGSTSEAIGTDAIFLAAPRSSPSPPSAIATAPIAAPAPPKANIVAAAATLLDFPSSSLSVPSLSSSLVPSLSVVTVSPTSTSVESIDLIGSNGPAFCKLESFWGDSSPSIAPRELLIS